MSRTFITGGAGFIGSHLVKRFLNKGDEVHILVRKNTSLERLSSVKDSSKFFIHIGDVTDSAFISQTIKKVQPQFVFHLAASGAYHWQDDPKQIFETNVFGSLYLFESLKELSNTPIVINVGSSSEYGQQEHPFTETDQEKPMSYYAISKVAQTHLAQYFSKAADLPVISVRLFTVYGPGEDTHKLIPTIIQKALNVVPIPLANPESAHDYIYVEDVVNAFEKMLNFPEYSGEVFNIGSGKQTSLKELIETAQQSWKISLQPQWNAYPSHRWDITNWISNQSKTKKMIGWEATTSLSSGLIKTMEWYKTLADEKTPTSTSSA